MGEFRISRQFRLAVLLSDLKAYQIAQRAGLHPSTLSRLINGIDRLRPNDQRVVAVGRVLGIQPEDCFEFSKDGE